MADENKGGNEWIVGFLVVAAVALVLKWCSPTQIPVWEPAQELPRMIQERDRAGGPAHPFLPR